MSSGCGDVLTLEDLRIAKQHQLFEAEVITGKQGGVASGADIDYATNPATGQTQKTLPAILRAAGFHPAAFTFTTGGTLSATDADKVVYDPVSKAWYSWGGALPKVIPAATNPLLDSNWKPYNYDTLTANLAAASGATLVGYQNPKSSVTETVKAALDKINTKVVFAADWGVKVDSSDNEDALWALGQYLSASTEPLYVVFPRGTSLVGSQQLAGASGQGYSYRPNYLRRSWSDLSAAGWFSVSQTNQKIVLDMTGWTLKLNNGFRLGAFDPVTGAVAPASPTEDLNLMASSGYMIKLYLAPNVEVLNGTTDGNLTGAIWGGTYGPGGYQVPAYNMWVNQSEGVLLSRHTFKNSAVDGLYLQATGLRNFLDVIPKTILDNCVFMDCGRNCFSLTGAANIEVRNPVIMRSGSKATGISTHASDPQAGVDIEAEGGNPYNIVFINPKIVDCAKNALLTASVPGTVNDVLIDGGVLQSYSSEGAVANSGNARNIKFRNVTIIGGVIDTGSPAAMGYECYSFENCTFINRYGNNYATNYLLSFRVSRFYGNTIDFNIPTTKVSTATIAISDQDGVTNGLMAERCKQNRLILSGNAANITYVNGLGGLNYFRNAELFVSAGGLTGGTTKLLVDTSSAAVGGLMTDSASFNFGGTMTKDTGRNIWYASKQAYVASLMTAAQTAPTTQYGVLDFGSVSGRFRTGYFDSGIIVRDGVTGTHYRVRVANGALNIVVDEN